jgi:hypothetical protein
MQAGTVFGRLWRHLSLLNKIRRRAPSLGRLVGPAPDRGAMSHRLGVLAIMKNESHLIEEWLDHYLSQGADRIYLIDNASTDDTLAKVEPWLKDGRVLLACYPEQHKQEQHYWSAFCHFGIKRDCDWLAIADIDEFWFCKSGERLADYLARQGRWDALYVRWTTFGSGNHDAQPNSVRRSLVDCHRELGLLPKCIFRTTLPQMVHDIEVHFVRHARFWRSKVAEHELQLNHYVAQSRAYWFGTKMTRGDAYFTGQDPQELSERFDKINSAASATCTRLRDLVNSGIWSSHAAAASRQGRKSSTIAVSPSKVQKL